MTVPERSELLADLDRERSALVGRIAAGLAHDLNGPIGIVLGFTELTMDLVTGEGSAEGLSPQNTARIGEYMDLIAKSAERARVLTREIWEFARAEPGGLDEIDVEAQLCLAARLAAPALRTGGVEVPDKANVLHPGETPAAGPIACADPALCLYAFVGVMLEASSSLPSGGRFGWNTSKQPDGGVQIDFRAEGWNGPPTRQWSIPGHARAAMELQGARLASGSDAGQLCAWLPPRALERPIAD